MADPSNCPNVGFLKCDFVKDEDLESYESEDEDQDESVAHRLVPFLVESRDGFAVAQKAALQVACGSLNPTETKLVMVTRNPQHVVNMWFACSYTLYKSS